MLVKGSVEDFLYIIVGVIWIAFSLYKGIQKKNAKKPQPQKEFDNETEPVEKKSSFETFLEEIMVKEEPTPPQQAVIETGYETVEEVELEEETKVFSYDDVYEESKYETANDVYKKADTQQTKLKSQLQTSHKKSRKPRFDLRKAVIYSEILNRRYF